MTFSNDKSLTRLSNVSPFCSISWWLWQVQLIRLYLCRLIEACIAHPLPAPVPGSERFLQRMQSASIPLCLVCNTGWLPGTAITFALDRLRLAGYLDYLVFSDAHGAAKPAPSIFECGLRLAGCPPRKATRIGDNWATDIRGAMSAGVYPIQLVLGSEDSDSREHAPLHSYDQIY